RSDFETLRVHQESGVVYADIAALPMNLIGPELVRDLAALVIEAEADPKVRIIVFASANADYFISHVDLTRIKEYRQAAAALGGEPSLGVFLRRLSTSPIVTIAQIEGRARGAGSEFVLACDMRFAALETATFAQIEVGFGLAPGAGGIQ